ncbi:hypothetical protein CDV31_013510 [Fusarium ambrosium]|uniref:Metallo-beta-lactamase domain-containing protein n=1 Tax=Fusarium ambrosium TaxID=131363 RepID=A0A428T2P7_9HYPO|nr:hypothetical protein CDV31_013510 [Fusarium ambrosium]
MVKYIGGRVLRIRPLYMAVSLNTADQVAVRSGLQNISFSFEEKHIKQRIDRFAVLGTTLAFARANLEPMEYSLVIQGGELGFAANVAGSYSVFDPTAPPSGYQDGTTIGFFFDKRSQQMVPAAADDIYDHNLELAVMFDPDSNLPYMIRSYENHPIFGPSTNDLLMMNYTSIQGVQFPRQFKTIYNNQHLLSNYIADEVIVNPGLDPTFFDGPAGQEPPALARNSEYSFAEIGQLSSIWLWIGPYTATLDTLTATQPFPDLPGVWDLSRDDPLGRRQLVLEVGDAVVVLDAPPHQSHLVIQWVRQTLGKSVTHVFLTHHHHDHALGVADYVAAGSKVIVPVRSKSYYRDIPDDQFLTYTAEEPFILEDDSMRSYFVDMGESVLTNDAAYAYITPRCPAVNSSAVVFDADHALLTSLPNFDQGTLHKLLVTLARDRVAKTA